MVFFIANDGTVIDKLPTPIYQGSTGVNDILVVAPFAEGLSASVAFKLPNGVRTQRYAMANVASLDGIVNKQTGQAYAGWKFSMPNDITQHFGNVTAQFFFHLAQGGVVASSSTTFTIGRGVATILPSEPTASVYDAIMENLSQLQLQLNNGTFAARAIYAWNDTYTYGANEIVYYPDYGEFGALVKSRQTGNLNNAPYDTSGTLNDEWWEVVFDFEKLQKAIVIWGFNKPTEISDINWEVK